MKRKARHARDRACEAACSTPVVFQYQRALDEFRRGGASRRLLKRMSELISLLDLTTTLGSGASTARRSWTRRC